MANPEAMNSTEQQVAERAASIKDPLILLYYAASTLRDFEGEQVPHNQNTTHHMEHEPQAAVIGNKGSRGKGKVKGSKEKMKPGLCQQCCVTEATVWRCVVKNNPAMGYHCNRCAMELRNNGILPGQTNEVGTGTPEQLILHLKQLAEQLQPKQEGSPCASHKRPAGELEGVDQDGKIKRMRSSSEGEDLSANATGCSSDATTHQLASQDVMMDTEKDGLGALLATGLSHESASFTIPAYRGENDKQPRLKREASRRPDRQLAVMKNDGVGNASGKRSKVKGIKKARSSTSTRSSNSGDDVQLNQTISAMQPDDYNSGSAPTAGLLSGMQAQQHVALPTPSLPLPATTTTAQQLAAGNPQNVMAAPVIAGAGRNVPQLPAMPRNNIATAGNQQLQPQFVLPPLYGSMPQATSNTSTGAPHPSLTPSAGMAPWQQMPMMPMMIMQPGMGMAWGQHMQAMPMMMAPGVTMLPGLQLSTPAMFMQPGMGMAFQAYAMQQLQPGQLNNAMSRVGNASS